MMMFEKRRQRDDESNDRFLDDLESIASKFIDWLKSDDLRTILATYYKFSKDNAPTPEEMRQKSREFILMKPNMFTYSENRNMQGGSQPQSSSW